MTFDQEIIKYTSDTHPDHANLVLSLQKINSIVAIVNEVSPMFSLSLLGLPD